MPRYEQFLAKTNRKDLKRIHVFMNEEAQAKLGEFYLCCAFRLRPDDVEAAGQDAQKLLALAREVANDEVEPLFQDCRDFVADYDWELHERLDGTTIWREVDDGLFWHHSFEAASASAYRAYRETALPPEASWPAKDDAAAINEILEGCGAAVAEGGRARGLAEDVYQQFLEASSMPVKASIRTALIDHGILAGEVVYRGEPRDTTESDGASPREAKL
mmetsp:Transcript_16658/g.33823  ORF Transcript_16658/g.33823 Transcript_16658/m.33823 type:complete len:218 (-) Transcript_16658:52-705(-)